MRIFGGKFRSTVRAPNQPDSVTIEDWRSLHLDIRVRFSSFLRLLPPHALTSELFVQPDSVLTIQDALTYVSHPQPVQVGQSGSSESSQQVFLESLPPVLVVHLKRFLYDATADGIVKINKPIQFAPELEIPPGAILLFLSPRVSRG